MLEFKAFNSPEEVIKEYTNRPEIKNAIICSVVNNFERLAENLRKQYRLLIFEANTPIPIINKYQSKASLGSDRLAASVGAFINHPNAPSLVIDAGTCIKYNFVNYKNEYLGGAIAPGVQMRFKALQHFTDRLPLMEYWPVKYTQLVGGNTEESLLSGVLTAVILETKGFISEYQKTFPDLKIFLTGGDAPFFESHLKNSIFADPYLIGKGLNAILNYNLR